MVSRALLTGAFGFAFIHITRWGFMCVLNVDVVVKCIHLYFLLSSPLIIDLNEVEALRPMDRYDHLEPNGKRGNMVVASICVYCMRVC